MTIKFNIPGEPIGKGRPKFTRSGIVYTPRKTKEYEELTALQYRAAAKGKSFGNEAVLMAVTAYYSIPKSWTVKKRAAAENDEIRPTVKPDGDNVLKALADGLNGIAFEDDKQIVIWQFCKLYSNSPHVDVVISNEI